MKNHLASSLWASLTLTIRGSGLRLWNQRNRIKIESQLCQEISNIGQVTCPLCASGAAPQTEAPFSWDHHESVLSKLLTQGLAFGQPNMSVSTYFCCFDSAGGRRSPSHCKEMRSRVSCLMPGDLPGGRLHAQRKGAVRGSSRAFSGYLSKQDAVNVSSEKGGPAAGSQFCLVIYWDPRLLCR